MQFIDMDVIGGNDIEDKHEKAIDTIHGRIVNVDLDVDADYNGTINDADEPLEETKGGIVCVGTNSLTPINLKIEPKLNALPGIATLSAIEGGNRIRLWQNANRTGEITLPMEWKDSAPVPQTLSIEGVTNSAAACDVGLKLEYDENPAGQSNPLCKCEDKIRLTVVKINMIPNSTEDVNLNGTYDAGDLYDWAVYNTPTPERPANIINDFEDWNCQRHTDTAGDHSGDWGDPGMQHKTRDTYND